MGAMFMAPFFIYSTVSISPDFPAACFRIAAVNYPFSITRRPLLALPVQPERQALGIQVDIHFQPFVAALRVIRKTVFVQSRAKVGAHHCLDFFEPLVAAVVAGAATGNFDKSHQVCMQVFRQALKFGNPAVMRQERGVRTERQQAIDRCMRLFGVEMRRCRGRKNERAILRIEGTIRNTEGIAGEHDVGATIMDAVMVQGMPGRMQEIQAAGAKIQAVTFVHRNDAFRGNRLDAAIKLDKGLFAINRLGAGNQFFRVHEMRRTARVHDDFRVRQFFQQGARATGVIKVNVRKQDVIDVLDRDILQLQRVQQRRHGMRGAGVNESGMAVAHDKMAGIKLRLDVAGVYRRDSGRKLGQAIVGRCHHSHHSATTRLSVHAGCSSFCLMAMPPGKALPLPDRRCPVNPGRRPAMQQFRRSLQLLLILPLFILLGCQPVNTGEQEHSVSTQGTAELMVAPDQAEITFGIEHRASDLETARAQAEQSVHGLLKVTEKLAIPAGQVDSTQIVTRPEYRYDDGERHFLGYFVARRVRITLHDLELLGPLTDGAFKAGINTAEPPQLAVSNPREHYRRVLELAATDAHANAKTLANSLNARLGKVLAISEGGSQDGPIIERSFRMTADAAPETAMQAGRIRFSATVSASFALKD